MKSFLLLLISACEVGLVILQKDANATIAIAAALNITRRVGFYDQIPFHTLYVYQKSLFSFITDNESRVIRNINNLNYINLRIPNSKKKSTNSLCLLFFDFKPSVNVQETCMQFVYPCFKRCLSNRFKYSKPRERIKYRIQFLVYVDFYTSTRNQISFISDLLFIRKKNFIHENIFQY